MQIRGQGFTKPYHVMYRGVYAYVQIRGQGFTKPYYVM